MPLAHWLIATLYVAGDALDKAERELAASLAFLAAEAQGPARFSAVAFDWLQGLLCLARGAADDAMPLSRASAHSRPGLRARERAPRRG